MKIHIMRLKYSDIQKCPHCIFAPEHYREDDTCKCNDPDEKIMKSWGYKWKDGQWR